MGKRIVIALGGNALGNTPYEQLALVTETAKPIVDLIAQGNEVIIAHGNGPQVGMINLGMATAAEAKAIKSDMPFRGVVEGPQPERDEQPHHVRRLDFELVSSVEQIGRAHV